MAYCKECNKIREENLTYCPDCSALLNKGDEICEQSTHDIAEVLLVSIATEEEALVIEGLLKSAEVYYIRRYDKIGDYLKVAMGTTTLGVSLYVREEDLEFANALLESEPEDLDQMFDENRGGTFDEEGPEPQLDDSSRIGGQLLLLLFILMFLIYLATR